ncbi:MAG TPA: carboxylating nicotinate-nucleotide diphosphorylase [Vicinamibacterales bacterium]|nr:carboxylating nicotinate-nucleotide diphosphorylase [Vicinamibacterales bacterium]
MTVETFAPLRIEVYRELVRQALAEDVGRGDVTTLATVDGSQQATAVLVAKSACVLAGLEVFCEALRQCDPEVEIRRLKCDGDACEPGITVAEVRGRAAGLLTAERTALNFIQRLSGTATLARQFVDAAGGRITILDTRKTTPLFRELEKYAVRAGGATNHRMRLDDGVLIKDNHIRLAGGVEAAVARMRRAQPAMRIEVEAQSLAQVDDALRAGAEMVLLDNLTTPDIVEAVRRCHGRAKTEISGGVTLARLPELAVTGADYVSVGALTHSAPAADLSFELEADEASPRTNKQASPRQDSI